MKDASSSAIYGSRAAYGVVLVTTKMVKGKMNVSYSGLVGMKTPTYLPKTVDSWEYASMLNEGMYNRNAAMVNIRHIHKKKLINLEMEQILTITLTQIGLIWCWINMY